MSTNGTSTTASLTDEATTTTTTTLVESSFGPGSFGIELGGLSQGQGSGVVLVDMEKGGQAYTKFFNVLFVGMKLIKVNDINVRKC